MEQNKQKQIQKIYSYKQIKNRPVSEAPKKAQMKDKIEAKLRSLACLAGRRASKTVLKKALAMVMIITVIITAYFQNTPMAPVRKKLAFNF